MFWAVHDGWTLCCLDLVLFRVDADGNHNIYSDQILDHAIQLSTKTPILYSSKFRVFLYALRGRLARVMTKSELRPQHPCKTTFLEQRPSPPRLDTTHPVPSLAEQPNSSTTTHSPSFHLVRSLRLPTRCPEASPRTSRSCSSSWRGRKSRADGLELEAAADRLGVRWVDWRV